MNKDMQFEHTGEALVGFVSHKLGLPYEKVSNQVDPIQLRILFIDLMLETLQNPKLGKFYPINKLVRHVNTQLS